MKIYKTKSKINFHLIAKFTKDNNVAFGKVTEDASRWEATMYLGDKLDLTINKLAKVINNFFIGANREYEIHVNSFITKNIDEEQIMKLFIEQDILTSGKIFSKKSITKKKKQNHILVSKNYTIENFKETILLSNQMLAIRFFQDMPANLCTTDYLTNEFRKLFSKSNKIKTKILNKADLKKLGMNLILSVNAGSSQDTKVIVAEYNNNSSSKKKIVLVGKGIIFDTGGYDLKRGKNILGMKYDMSGAAIAGYILDTVDKLDLKTNVSIIIPITDNLVDSTATLPGAIINSMSGKSVEITNTDAEGRLILADSITYASKIMGGSLLIDISTLTGSVVYALGNLYTGVWSTNDKNWNLLEQASQKSNEKIWRMPLDEEYIENVSKNKLADTSSCSTTEYSDCNIAASWLNSFADKKDYIHIDIAGTADLKEKGQSPMLKTVVEFIKKYK
ncbi:MAG: leucyl aminopeptidase family protein [Mycoplasmataceae bacterium]|nr:leucyl aminopeptidase family protein [Mycoplasmataceae bacterium]